MKPLEERLSFTKGTGHAASAQPPRRCRGSRSTRRLKRPGPLLQEMRRSLPCAKEAI